MSTERFHDLSEDIIEYFNNLEKNMSLPVDLRYVYQADDKQKALLKIAKIADRYSCLLKAELLISFNESYFDAFDDEARNILIEQELALIEFDLDKGSIKMGKPNFVTSTGVLDKYGQDAVKRANLSTSLYQQQIADKEKEEKQNKPKKNKY